MLRRAIVVPVAWVVAMAFAWVLAAPASAVAAASVDDRLARADALYAARGRSVDENRRADPAPIADAIEIYETLLTESPADLDVRWRLLRALYFAGDHSSEPPDRRRERLERARRVAAAGMDQIADAFADGTRLEELDADELRARVPDEHRERVAAVYYWAAVARGAWSQLTGTWSAITDGVANRLYDFSSVVIALRPEYERGGAYRLLSYLHATVPNLPFVSGWVDEDLAVPEAEKALGVDPDDRGNRVIYGIALLETRDASADEARAILREVARLEPRDGPRTEDLSIRALALEQLGDDPSSPYRHETPAQDGTGRVYLGRETSHVMGHLAVGWLERPERATTELPDRVVLEMDLDPGDVVADIGAGSGYFTLRIADVVKEGRVLAVDIQPQMLEIIDRRTRRAGVDNVRTILGSSIDPRLPERAVDAVLLVDAYHEFSHPKEMGEAIARALAPGGRLYLVEYRGEDASIPIKPLHKMTVAQARRELEAIGLRFVEVRDFLPEQHFLVFEKPASGAAAAAS